MAEQLLTWALTAVIVIAAPLLTIFDLPGNTLLFLSAVGYAFYQETLEANLSALGVMAVVYICGEAWEFFVGLFGIRREKVPWFGVFVIGVGGIVGTLAGTGILPILGSFIGGVAGAFLAAFLYEYGRSGVRENACRIAWAAAKVRFLALSGKLAAGIALALLLARMVFFTAN